MLVYAQLRNEHMVRTRPVRGQHGNVDSDSAREILLRKRCNALRAARTRVRVRGHTCLGMAPTKLNLTSCSCAHSRIPLHHTLQTGRILPLAISYWACRSTGVVQRLLRNCEEACGGREDCRNPRQDEWYLSGRQPLGALGRTLEIEVVCCEHLRIHRRDVVRRRDSACRGVNFR